jgi:hypothetical protein
MFDVIHVPGSAMLADAAAGKNIKGCMTIDGSFSLKCEFNAAPSLTTDGNPELK